jgi:hypothetical protein
LIYRQDAPYWCLEYRRHCECAGPCQCCFASRTPNPTPSSTMQWNSPPPNPQSNPTPPSSLQNIKPRAKPPAKQTPPTSSAKTDVWIFVAQCSPHVGDLPGLVTPEASEGQKEQRHRWYHGVDRARGCESPSPPYPHIDLVKRQGVPANKERLNLVLLGNPATGEYYYSREFLVTTPLTFSSRETHSGEVVCTIPRI